MCVYWSILAVWQNFIGIFLNIIWKKCLIIYNGLSRAAIKNQFHCIYVWGPIWLTCCVFKITTIYYLIEISIYRFQWYDLQVSHVTQVSKHKCTATAGARAVSFLCQSREKQSYLEKTIFENKTIDIRQSYQCENFLFFLSIACKNKHGSTNWYKSLRTSPNRSVQSVQAGFKSWWQKKRVGKSPNNRYFCNNDQCSLPKSKPRSKHLFRIV